MSPSKKSDKRFVPVAEIQDRGRTLQHRFRVAGIPQYTRWFADKEPAWFGDASLINRIQMLFNGRGSVSDLDLLKKCEAVADRFLGTSQAAA